MIGNIEFEVAGVKRGFRFGTYAIAVAQRESGSKTIDELWSRVGIGKSEGDALAVLCLFYGAAVQYCKHKKINEDFNISDVSEWLEEIGQEQTERMFLDMLKQYNTKNSNPPVNPGELVAA